MELRDLVEPFYAICVQCNIKFVGRGADPTDVIKKNLKRSLELIDFVMTYSKYRGGDLSYAVKLITFPEFHLQGSHFGTHEEWFDLSITIPGEVTDKLGEKAKEHNMYIVSHAYEVDDEWPGHFFNTAFIVSPEGKVILKYRKINTTNNLLSLATSPGDVLEKYKEELFPVADTPIGKIGCFTCYDGFFPELVRALALNGAEIMVRPTVYSGPWASEPFGWWELSNRMRAIENLAYVVAPNAAWLLNTTHPLGYSIGRSMIVDFEGRIMAQASSQNEEIVSAVLDIDRLREKRRKLIGNFLAQLRTEVYAPIYRRTIYPPNRWLEKPPETYQEIWDVCRKSFAKLIEKS